MVNSIQIGLLNLFIIGVFSVLGPCDETLPPYIEPEKFLEGNVSGIYVLTITANRLTVFVTVKNIYEETLDDTVSIRGTVEIRSARLPHIKKTFSIGPADILSGSNYYNRQTRRLTLDPGNSLTFSVSWDFSLDDRGLDPRNDFFVFFQDPTCKGIRCRAAREDFVLSGEIHIFNERAPVLASALFPVCYVSKWVDPRVCVSVLTEPPCIEEPPPTWAARCYPFSDVED